MNERSRAQLRSWRDRYRTLAAILCTIALLVWVFPTLIPLPDLVGPDDRAVAAATPTSGDNPTPSTGGATAIAPAGPSPTPTAPAPSTTPSPDPRHPSFVAPAVAAPPPPPEPDTVVCPLDLPRQESDGEPLPLADLLNVAGPVLPLLGPFVPFALAGTPLIEPVLPVVTPLLPITTPILIRLGPAVADLTGPFAGASTILLLPIEEGMAPYTDDMLAAEQDFIDQIQPLIDAGADSGTPDCAAIVVASLGGAVLDVSGDVDLEGLLNGLLGPA